MNEELHTPPDAPHAGDFPLHTADSAGALPLRAEIFGAAQMALHGRQLAASHTLAQERGRERLLARLADNADVIARACASLARSASAPSSEGMAESEPDHALLDHHDLIDEHIRFVRRHLTRPASRALPCLAIPLEGSGNPRVYQLALEAVIHGDGRLEDDTLARFVAAYQEGAPLLLDELRVFPLMLRLALVDNLRRLAVRVQHTRQQRGIARDWAGRMEATADARPGDLVLLMADMARQVEPMDAAFVAELARRLEGRDGPLEGVLQWLATRLADDGVTLGQQLELDTIDEAADAVSLANSIASLRLLETVDWTAFLETASGVEQALRTDPAGVYPRMDAASRTAYRQAVARLARQSGHSEAEAAAEALALAGAAAPGDELDSRSRHVGHYLAGDGLPALRARLGRRPGLLPALRDAARRRPLLSWLGTAGTLTLLFVLALVVHAWRGGAGAGLLVVVGVLATCGASQLALALTELMVTRLVAPRPLPRMDASRGIPAQSRSMIVVPALLASREEAASLCRRLELHYLTERDPQLRFCLLLDFPDAATETLPADAGLLEAAQEAIAALNARYAAAQSGAADEGSFLLLCRRRTWSASERAWIGRERKRGALADLHALLRSAAGARERFALVAGSAGNPAEVRYLIVLDADAQLAQGSARRMVAAMAHPLNRPLLAADGRSVAAGHGFLQPRVTNSLPLDGNSRYARLCSGEPGIDPGVSPLPDLWQDLFGAGANAGKGSGQGIYDVDACARVLAGLPEHTALSHDLLADGLLAGGLLNDVQLYQPCPDRYRDDMARRARRIRGAWQLAGWLRARIKIADGEHVPNPLGPVARWKLLDSLRRSLVAPTLMTMLILCWARLPSPAFWSAAALSVFFLPAFFDMLVRLADKPHDAPWRQHLANWGQGARFVLRRAVMQAVVLPHEAWVSLEAIAQGGWRMLVSHRRLLQAAPPAARPRLEIEQNVRQMWFALALPACVAVLLTFMHPLALFAAAPLLLLWFLSPVIAWWVSLPGERGAPAPPDSQALFLLGLARRHWGFFETHVGPQDNWLPPDSMQEHPHARVTHRTSPTDMGIGLLANLAAWDFGFLPQAGLLARVRAAFDSMALLARHRGHFCSWYDTQTLAPLQPMMVATSDSGNLAAHLLTLAAGLEALADAPVASTRPLAGLRATLQVVQDCAREAGTELPPALREAIERARGVLQPQGGAKAETLPGLADCLASAAQAAAAIVQALPHEASAALRDWSARLEADCAAARAELLALAPWVAVAQEYVFEARLTRIPTLRELAAYEAASVTAPALAAMVEEGATRARARLDGIAELAERARDFADMDFGFLYRPDTGLLASGYNASDEVFEEGSCALLASEARLASFIGIARGQLPQAHWYALKRPLGMVDGEQLLLSNGGAMSDYLAPLLVMPLYRGTLLEKTCQALVRVQAAHADRYRIPWGMSESGFNTFDAAMNYGYRAFGVPGTGLSRGPAGERVIAPYASLLALTVAPNDAIANLERMAGLGWIGQHGFYEAADYSPARLAHGQQHALVRAFMAHHQGMGLLALSHLLHERPMQARFAADPALAAALPLLYERVPKSGAFDVQRDALVPHGLAPAEEVRRTVGRPVAAPEVQLLSNGRYHVMVTGDGAGYSRWRDLALTRWRGDAVSDDAGLACYLRDLDSGAVWSSAWLPTRAQPEHEEAVFPEGRVELRRVDHGIELHTEIVVAPADDVELRRMRIRNGSAAPRRIELTTYVEPVLAAPGSSRPALRSELLDGRNAILCTPRSGDAGPWLLHLMAVHGHAPGEASFETDRLRFLGRGDAGPLPAALRTYGPLGGGADAAEPALAIRRVLLLAPGEEAAVDLVLGVAPTREEALRLAGRYADRHEGDRACELAWTEAQALLRQLDIAESDAAWYMRLASALLYPNRALRAEPTVIAGNRLGQARLPPYGISGELPIVLVQVRDAAGLGLLRQLVQAHGYWRSKGFAADLVVWYADPLQGQVARLLAAGGENAELPGGLFAFAADGIPEEERVLMQSAARVVLQDRRGGLFEQLRRAAAVVPADAPPLLQPTAQVPAAPLPPPALVLDNGLGGFTSDGAEYVIRTAPGQATPMPWTNLLANPAFAARISESGEAVTWSADGHCLSAAGDGPGPGQGGEAFYLRDEASGAFWSPTALPAPSGGAYLTRHGFGYSVFEHAAHGIRSEMTSFVAMDAPLRYTVLKLRNEGSTRRRLSVTGYVEWVLGRTRAQDALHVVTGRDPDSGALVARSAWHGNAAGGAAFFHVDAANPAFTCDRLEFIGRNGDLARPQALGRTGLSGSVGAGFDPCAALQVAVELQPGEERELVFVLGAGALVPAQRDAAQALSQVRAWWNDTLGAVRIETPDPALDVLANGWLLYQSITGGLWAHGGAAWSFRDRLQQAMALVHARPQLLRAELLQCAAHQFVEDGTRHAVHLRAADDLLWLPLATCRYLAATGDLGILDESIPWLEERALETEQELDPKDDRHGDLYAHCVRAIRHVLRFGAHGLPLDEEGGENVWLALVLLEVLRGFTGVAERRADYGFAITCRAGALALAAQVEDHAWEVELYRSRLDGGDATEEGTPALDLNVQSWAVLSGAASPGRAACAMAAADAHLVRCDAGQPLDTAAWTAMAFARLGQGERAWELLDKMIPAHRDTHPPYVAPAEVFGAPSIGRGEANWYTGAAGLMYRLIVEVLLGVERRGQALVLAPQLPQGWPGFRLQYRYRNTRYAIEVRAAEAGALLVDGQHVAGNTVQLVDDGAHHRVELRLARRQGTAVSAEREETQSKTTP
ncbi:GH36-type glycosyl hydrolase domain-containing protein [Massilia sp. SYSU DXS3249]